MARNTPIVGLALSGGSTWGVAHVGAIAALEEAGIPIQRIAGTSAGAVVASLFAFGCSTAQMSQAAEKLEWKHISRFGYSKLGVASNASLGRIIVDMIGAKNIEDANIPLAIVATNIETNEKKIFTQGSVADAVRASSAIPGYFTPVEIDGELHVDGFLSENLPVSAVKKIGATFTIGVHLAGERQQSRPSSVRDIIARSFEILSQQYVPSGTVDILIEPDLNRFNSRSFKEAQMMYEQGYQAAKSAVPEIRMKLAQQQISWWQRLLGRFKKSGR